MKNFFLRFSLVLSILVLFVYFISSCGKDKQTEAIVYVKYKGNEDPVKDAYVFIGPLQIWLTASEETRKDTLIWQEGHTDADGKIIVRGFTESAVYDVVALLDTDSYVVEDTIYEGQGVVRIVPGEETQTTVFMSLKEE